MNTNRTFTIIKPDAVAGNHTGEILDIIIKEGYKIIAMKYLVMSEDDARQFYAVHKTKPFFESLTAFMSSGAILVAILEKENAVSEFRKLIGATNPAEADDNTIRKIYAKSLSQNAIHGSDSDENAAIESAFFFSKRDEIV